MKVVSASRQMPEVSRCAFEAIRPSSSRTRPAAEHVRMCNAVASFFKRWQHLRHWLYIYHSKLWVWINTISALSETRRSPDPNRPTRRAFFFENALSRTPHPIRPTRRGPDFMLLTRRGPDPNRPTRRAFFLKTGG